MRRALLIASPQPACSFDGRNSPDRCIKRLCSFSLALHPGTPTRKPFEGILRTRPAASKLLASVTERLARQSDMC